MRLATWNCCRGPLQRKVSLLAVMNPDVAVIQECARPSSESEQCLWFGDNPRQGLAVVVAGDYRVRRLRRAPAVPRYAFPVQILGPHTFNLLAIWSKGQQPYPYVRAVLRAVKLYRKLIQSGPTVLAGDFNSNVTWDHAYPDDQNHSALVRVLAGMGLVSAYHAYFGEAFGTETRPTYHFLWKESRPYHIDYCFVPEAWVSRLTAVEVGPYESWRRHSDHRPVLVDVEPDAA